MSAELLNVIQWLTSLATPVAAYWIYKLDRKLDKHADDIKAQQLANVQLQGEVKVLQILAKQAENSVTRREFEQATAATNGRLDEIIARLNAVQ